MDAVQIALAVIGSGAVASGITQFTKAHVPSGWRTLFALGVSVVVGALGALLAWALTGDLTVQAFTAQVMLVVGAAQTIYAAVDKATSPKVISPLATDTTIDHETGAAKLTENKEN